MRRNLLFLILSIQCSLIYAEIPAGYYNAAHGKENSDIKTALHNIIREHTYLSYNASTQTWWYTYFKQTDWHPDGYFWDMYSNEQRVDYNGSVQHREHCMPRSWWKVGTSSYGDANGDLFNLYPSDAKANNAKSNHPLGVVLNATFDNGVVKIGNSSLSGYAGTVFEPANEYKGDYARTYMYMVTCYEDYADIWNSEGIESMLENNTYPTLNEYSVNLLMTWHIDDPVSQKELDRNEAVYNLQKNRNPFIDLPQIAYYIWGDSINEIWNYCINPVTLDYFHINKYNIIYSNNNILIESKIQKNAECYIYSINGQLLQEFKTETNTSSHISLLQGFYVIKAIIGNSVIYEKVFIE